MSVAPELLTGAPLCRPRVDAEVWDFIERIGFRCSHDHEWWTADTFASDGASIPFFLRWAFGHPFRSDYIRPAALHDYFYCTWAPLFTGRLTSQARAAVDHMFYEALLADGVHPAKAWAMYAGVRSGGWNAWNRHARGKCGRQETGLESHIFGTL